MAGAAESVPSGRSRRLLDRALEAAYATHAVERFEGKPRGRRRLHRTPRVGEVEACRPWMAAEVEAVRPRALLGMGATAARSLFGTKVKATADRGRPPESPLAPVAAATIHPSAILRLRDLDQREAELASFVADREAVADAAQGAVR
ncbi:MAG TPA: uracil-DNA glycosylase family protein [Solirubrobacterales bacterium]|nr:uracil-DNA glycosylase family protein [Solirubrobacterales bacterium]